MNAEKKVGKLENWLKYTSSLNECPRYPNVWRTHATNESNVPCNLDKEHAAHPCACVHSFLSFRLRVFHSFRCVGELTKPLAHLFDHFCMRASFLALQGNASKAHREPNAGRSLPWLPDGFTQIFRMYAFGPSGLKDYGSATLCCKILPSGNLARCKFYLPK